MTAERAHRLMTADEFLAWADERPGHYELVDGVAVAMAPASRNHARIAQNIGTLADSALAQRRPCRAVQQGGVRLPDGGNVYIPDVLVTCEPLANGRVFEAPRLVVEILSPSTRSYDEREKLPGYGTLPTVEEVWLVESNSASRVRLVHAWQRIDGRWQDGLPLIGRATFTSHVLGVEVSLDAVYDLMSLAVSPEEGAEEAGAQDANRDDGEHRQP
jgi:Uma2 family endonuclease